MLNRHDGDGGFGWSPIYGLEILDGPAGPVWKFYRKDRYTKRDGSFGYRNTELWREPAVVDEAIDFVFHVKWTTDGSGFMELYRNRELVWGEQGIMTMNNSAAPRGPYSKWGIYGAPTRILFDEVRIAEGPDRLADVSPGL